MRIFLWKLDPTEERATLKKNLGPYNIPLYWLVHRDPYVQRQFVYKSLAWMITSFWGQFPLQSLPSGGKPYSAVKGRVVNCLEKIGHASWERHGHYPPNLGQMIGVFSESNGWILVKLHPLKINVGYNGGGERKIIFLSKWVICRFPVSLPGCVIFHQPRFPWNRGAFPSSATFWGEMKW